MSINNRQLGGGRTFAAAVVVLGMGTLFSGCSSDGSGDSTPIEGDLAEGPAAARAPAAAEATRPATAPALDERAAARAEAVRVTPTLLAKVELGKNHVIEFAELIPGVVMTTEKFKIGEATPVLTRGVPSLASAYRELAGVRVEAKAVETLEAADERVVARRALLEAKAGENRSVQLDAIPEQSRVTEITNTEALSGATPVSSEILVEKGPCSFNLGNHEFHVDFFHRNFCGPTVDSCFAQHQTRFRFIDHLSFKTSRQVFVAGMNAQLCNNVNWDVFFRSDCGNWEACSHGFVFQEQIAPAFAHSRLINANGFIIEPNIMGSGNDADKDVFLMHDIR